MMLILKAIESTLFTTLISKLIGYYVLATQSLRKYGTYNTDVSTFFGALVTYYKPVTYGNIDAIIALAFTPLPSL